MSRRVPVRLHKEEQEEYESEPDQDDNEPSDNEDVNPKPMSFKPTQNVFDRIRDAQRRGERVIGKIKNVESANPECNEDDLQRVLEESRLEEEKRKIREVIQRRQVNNNVPNSNEGYVYLLKNTEKFVSLLPNQSDKTVKFNNLTFMIADSLPSVGVLFAIYVNDIKDFLNRIQTKLGTNSTTINSPYDLKKTIELVTKVYSFYDDNKSLDKDMHFYKPNGFDAFVTNWLLLQKHKYTIDEAYEAYENMMKNDFCTNEYAEKSAFKVYMVHCGHNPAS